MRTTANGFNSETGVNYTPLPGLVFTGLVGMYYNYDNESMFIPGLTDKTIVPISDTYGTANNMVRSGVGETSNMYLNLNARYSKMFNRIHQLNAIAGAQILTTKNEFDVGEGRNTDNDFYQTLGNTQADGRRFYGYLNKWNWMSYYGHADCYLQQSGTGICQCISRRSIVYRNKCQPFLCVSVSRGNLVGQRLEASSKFRMDQQAKCTC